jgi:hypothetical protein
MESYFGKRLDDIRVHTGPEAARTSKALGAEAFTMGRDIYFGQGKYNPQSRKGMALLGHEITHTLQGGGKIYRAVDPFSLAAFGLSFTLNVLVALRGQERVKRAKEWVAKDIFEGESYEDIFWDRWKDLGNSMEKAKQQLPEMWKQYDRAKKKARELKASIGAGEVSAVRNILGPGLADMLFLEPHSDKERDPQDLMQFLAFSAREGELAERINEMLIMPMLRGKIKARTAAAIRNYLWFFSNKPIYSTLDLAGSCALIAYKTFLESLERAGKNFDDISIMGDLLLAKVKGFKPDYLSKLSSIVGWGSAFFGNPLEIGRDIGVNLGFEMAGQNDVTSDEGDILKNVVDLIFLHGAFVEPGTTKKLVPGFDVTRYDRLSDWYEGYGGGTWKSKEEKKLEAEQNKLLRKMIKGKSLSAGESARLDALEKMLKQPTPVRMKGALSIESEPAEQEARRVERTFLRHGPAASAVSRARPGVTTGPRIARSAMRRGSILPAISRGLAGMRPTAGRPLPRSLRSRMESNFGADFGHVRIHTDRSAGQLSRMMGAEAFTYGRHIFFSPGQFDPGSRRGQGLLAHELTHTLQQYPGGSRQPLGYGVSLGSSRYEREAERAEQRFLSWHNRSQKGLVVLRRHIRTSGVGLQPSMRARIARLLDRAIAKTDDMLRQSGEIPAMDVRLPRVQIQTSSDILELTEEAAVDNLRRLLMREIRTSYLAQKLESRARTPRFSGAARPAIFRKIKVGGQDYVLDEELLKKFDVIGKEYLRTINESKATYSYSDEPHLERDTKFHEGVVNAMDQANIGGGCRYFRLKEDPYLDEDYWEKKGYLRFWVKEGVKPADAMKRLFERKDDDKKSKLECLAMTIAVEYKALLHALGDDEFNRKFAERGSLEISQRSRGLWNVLDQPMGEAAADLLPGDWIYFKNHAQYLEKHPEGYWQGENAVYDGREGGRSEGERMFSGFGARRKSESEMKRELMEAFNKDPTEADKEHPRYDPSLGNKKITADDIPGILPESLIRPKISATRIPKP